MLVLPKIRLIYIILLPVKTGFTNVQTQFAIFFISYLLQGLLFSVLNAMTDFRPLLFVIQFVLPV